MENLESILATIYELAVRYGLKLLLAIVTLVIGLWIIKLIMKAIGRNMEKREVDPTLRQFLGSLLSMLLKILLVISVIAMIGVEMTSFVAILVGLGLIVIDSLGYQYGNGPRLASRGVVIAAFLLIPFLVIHTFPVFPIIEWT